MRLPLWRLRTWRRRLFELAGSDRFSKPAFGGIDEKLQQHLPSRGFFVEAGALDGVYESNTYFLEAFCGWRGILVEPSPAMFSRLAVNRPSAKAYHCALVAPDFEGRTISLQDEHAFGKVVEPSAGAASGSNVVTVPARTLQWVLADAQAPHIDLLALDVEGYEVEVLKGLDFGVDRPGFVLIEQLGKDRAAGEVLERHGYALVDRLSPRDFLYSAP
jgi:FkbM family methyltransferase